MTNAAAAAAVAQDALAEGRVMDAVFALTEIVSLDEALLRVARPVVGSAVQLGRAVYTVTQESSFGLELRGKRGGESTLVQNAKNPDMWAHTWMVGYRSRSQWYRRTATGEFVTAVVA